MAVVALLKAESGRRAAEAEAARLHQQLQLAQDEVRSAMEQLGTPARLTPAPPAHPPLLSRQPDTSPGPDGNEPDINDVCADSFGVWPHPMTGGTRVDTQFYWNARGIGSSLSRMLHGDEHHSDGITGQ